MYKNLLENIERNVYNIFEICGWGHTGGMPFVYRTEAPVSEIYIRISDKYCVVLNGIGILIPTNFYKIVEKTNDYITLESLNRLPDNLEEELWDPLNFQYLFSNHLEYEKHKEYIGRNIIKLKYRCLNFIFRTSKNYFINLAKTFDKLCNNRNADNALVFQAPKVETDGPNYINLSFDLSNCKYIYFVTSLANKYDLFPKFSLQSDQTLKLEKIYYRKKDDENPQRIIIKDLKEDFKELDSLTYKVMLAETDMFKFHIKWESKLKPLFFTDEDDNIIQTQLTFRIENNLKFKHVFGNYHSFELRELLAKHLTYCKFVLEVNDIHYLIQDSPKWFLDMMEFAKTKDNLMIQYYEVETYIGILNFIENRQFNKIYEERRSCEIEKER